MNWITTDQLGAIAFQTKKDALAAFPSCRAVQCSFSMGFAGWLAMDPYGSDNGSTIQTPDGRNIPVVMGWGTAGTRVCGMRGGTPKADYSDLWRSIMVRVVEAGLQLHAYKQNGNA